MLNKAINLKIRRIKLSTVFEKVRYVTVCYEFNACQIETNRIEMRSAERI